MKLTAGDRLAMAAGRLVQLRRPWHELPRPLGLLALEGIRTELRLENLYDPAPPDGGGPYAPGGPANRPFGRNGPLWGVHPPDDPELLSPSPREVSRRLLARDGAPKRVPFLNLLAGAWLQFMVHDWMSHGPGDRLRDPISVPLRDDDGWPLRDEAGGMAVRRTPPSAAATAMPDAPVFDNVETAWWDGSQLYGSRPELTRELREHAGGRLRLTEDGLLPKDEERGIELTGVNGNWWLGLAMLHTVFAREHNAVAAMLAQAHPEWDDERLFVTARRITAAVAAKIHTVEWTPAIVTHPTVAAAMRANWYGVLGRRAGRLLRRLTRWDVLTGIPGSRCDDHGVPYSLTEEFVAVYRMHPLLPDALALREDGGWREVTLLEVTGTAARDLMETRPLDALIESFAHMRPGFLALHNYPDTLRDLPRGREAGPDSGTRIDLATIDVLRDRERGVPRYNAFRRMLRLRPAHTFAELTGGDMHTAGELAAVYGDVEAVDLMVGLYAEPLLPGFGFSETAFRIFVLMASRRLKSDPAYTDRFTADELSPEGLRWIDRATMADVLQRNVPGLEDRPPRGPAVFAPWGPDPLA